MLLHKSHAHIIADTLYKCDKFSFRDPKCQQQQKDLEIPSWNYFFFIFIVTELPIPVVVIVGAEVFLASQYLLPHLTSDIFNMSFEHWATNILKIFAAQALLWLACMVQILCHQLKFWIKKEIILPGVSLRSPCYVLLNSNSRWRPIFCSFTCCFDSILW